MEGPREEMGIDWYDILGVPVGATLEEIESAYRREARRWHPDVNYSPDAGLHMRRLNEARDALIGAHRTGDFGRVALSPSPVADPATVDFGAVRPTCRHAPVTVRLRNRGGSPESVSMDPEEGTFWAIAEIRGGDAEGEVAQFDLEARASGVGPGCHRDVIGLFLDDAGVELDVVITVERDGRPAAVLWTSVLVALAAAAALVAARGGPSPVTLALAALVVAAALAAGAVVGHITGWPENWSSVRPAAVWFDEVYSSPYTLRHHVRWPAEMLPAGRRWTSACVADFAEAAGVGPVETVFSARCFQTRAGYRPGAPARWRGPYGACVFVPWTARLARGAAARTAAHQVGHLAWTPYRHDADFFRRVQALIDAAPCPSCAAHLRDQAG